MFASSLVFSVTLFPPRKSSRRRWNSVFLVWWLLTVAPKVMDDRVYYKFYIISQLCHAQKDTGLALSFVNARRRAQYIDVISPTHRRHLKASIVFPSGRIFAVIMAYPWRQQPPFCTDTVDRKSAYFTASILALAHLGIHADQDSPDGFERREY